jgi:hypothetical protein
VSLRHMKTEEESNVNVKEKTTNTTKAKVTPPTWEELKARRRPTYEDLRRRVEEGGYGSHSDRMDSREWYHLCYFQPLEGHLFVELLHQYPDMDYNDKCVCVSLWIYAHSISTPTYENISERILGLVEPEDYEVLNDPDTDEDEEQLRTNALRHAFEQGYISFNEEKIVTLRQDIEEFLSKLVDKECAESDAAIIAASIKEQLGELQEIHRQKQFEFWRDGIKFHYRKNEKGEHIPLTEQEQQEWIQQLAEKYDRRITE